MDIQIPFNNYQLNIQGLDIYVNDTPNNQTDTAKITKQGIIVTSEIFSASISGESPTGAGETYEFGIYFEDSGDSPIMSGSMTSYKLSGMPVDMFAFDTVTSKTENTNFNWNNIALPFKSIYIKIYKVFDEYTKIFITEQPISIPQLSASNMTYDSAVITISDISDFQALVLFKEDGNDERIDIINSATTNSISLTGLEMGTDYVVWLDTYGGLMNILRFSTLGAPIWVKTDNGYKKGKLWVKTSNGWEKAKGIYCRKSTTDSWKKGV